MKLRLLLVLLTVALTASGCATYRDLKPGQSTLADVEGAMGAPAERRQVGGETWLYYPDQPFGRKVLVARLAADKLIGVEQRLTDENISKLVPNRSRSEDVLALFGQPYKRFKFPLMERESWSWHMERLANLPAGLHVQMSPDGVVREIVVLDETNDDERTRP